MMKMFSLLTLNLVKIVQGIMLHLTATITGMSAAQISWQN